MPLKLLKRTSKQYNVVSKTTFVISVVLLDNVIMECTLDAESTGTDCLQNISQRLGLHQPEFFGLRYISRGVPPRQRWVDLNRPLKKQLEKYAEDSQLSLGVMYYVSDVNLLKDEMTRYHYFLQLKSDVIDGKLNCSIDQAISLAAYSLQAEFGDFDPERHTTQYLRDFTILPKELMERSSGELASEGLYEAVARQYGSLVGFPPPLAEIYYVILGGQLDGYGQEAYPAKDDGGHDILLCISTTSLVVRRRDWTHLAAFRWSDIKSLTGHKKLLVLESYQSQRSMEFHFTDAEIVKYLRKMCGLQSAFSSEGLIVSSSSSNELGTDGLKNNNSYNSTLSTTSNSFSQSDSSSSYYQNQSSVGNLRRTPDLIAQNYMIESESQSNSTLENRTSCQQFLTGPNKSVLWSSSQLVGRSLQDEQLYRPLTPIIGASLVLNNSSGSNILNNSENELGNSNKNNLLPSYRAAPEYELAVQMKYGQNSISNGGGGRIVGQNPVYSHQQNEEDEPIYQNEIVSKMNSIELRDSQQQPKTTYSQPNPVEVPDIYVVDSDSNINSIENEAGANSQTTSQNISNNTQLYVIKPPPPYPGTQYYEMSQKNTQNPHYSHTSRGSLISHSEALKEIKAQLIQKALPNFSEKELQNYSQSTKNNNIEAKNRTSTPEISPTVSSSQLPKSNFLYGITRSLQSSFESKNKIHSSNRDMSKEGYNLGSNEWSREEFNRIKNTPVPYRNILDPNIMKEFQAIQKAKANPNFTTAMRGENAKRNRSPNILPYEDNCIRLSSSRQNSTGYINASPVSAQIGDRVWKYIVGQIPLPYSAPELWQMIWETECKILVVLERDISFHFYPTNGSTLTFDDFSVSESGSSSSIGRELLLSYGGSKKRGRTVWLLPYEEEWKDDVPIHTEHFLCFLEEVNSVQRRVSDSSSPLTVLCGTGAGRSGVFILSDLLLHAADSGHKLRCDTLLSELRTQRMLLVTHPPQYAFVLETLAKYLAQSRLI